MTSEQETYSVLLTPAGTGAIGVVRVVGREAVDIVSQFFRPLGAGRGTWQWSQRLNVSRSGVTAGKLFYGHFVVDDEPIDDVIVSHVSWMDRPGVDISAHGGVRVIERILLALDRAGAPFRECSVARPPVWPAASYMEHEAAYALSTARTSRAVRFLAWQRRYLKEHLAEMAPQCAADSVRVGADLQGLLAGWSVAKKLITGVTIALVGPPNTGKSTLFNCLAGRTTALVSAREGTTRDWVTASVEFNGVPVTLVDTAGQYETADLLERNAIGRGWTAALDADLCLLVLDGSRAWTDRERCFCRAVRDFGRSLVVANKADLPNVWTAAEKESRGELRAGSRPVSISGRTGAGVDQISVVALSMLGFGEWSDRSPCFFTARQTAAALDILSDLVDRPAYAGERIKRQLIGLYTRGPGIHGRSMIDDPPARLGEPCDVPARSGPGAF